MLEKLKRIQNGGAFLIWNAIYALYEWQKIHAGMRTARGEYDEALFSAGELFLELLQDGEEDAGEWGAFALWLMHLAHMTGHLVYDYGFLSLALDEIGAIQQDGLESYLGNTWVNLYAWDNPDDLYPWEVAANVWESLELAKFAAQMA